MNLFRTISLNWRNQSITRFDPEPGGGQSQCVMAMLRQQPHIERGPCNCVDRPGAYTVVVKRWSKRAWQLIALGFGVLIMLLWNPVAHWLWSLRPQGLWPALAAVVVLPSLGWLISNHTWKDDSWPKK
jgi:hypothetical protein